MADLKESNRRKATYNYLQDTKRSRSDCSPSNSTTVKNCNAIIQNLIEDVVRAKVAEELGPAIIKAVQRTERRKVQVLIKDGANVNTQSNQHQGKSLLHLAANDILDILIENGADIDIKDANGHTPLLNAAIKNQWGKFDILFQSGANVNYDDIYSFYVLHKGIDVIFFESMIKRCNYIDETKLGQLLLNAVQRQDAAIVKIILRYGAKSSLTILQTAIRKGRKLIVKMLLQSAACHGQKDIVELVLQHNSSLIDLKDHDGFTPLALAVINKNKEIVCFLIENNANLEASTDKLLQTPLHLAIKNRLIEITDILLKHGSNPNAIDSQGQTAVHLAVSSNNVPLMELLLRHNANFNTKTFDLSTPLHVATKKGFKDILQVLLTSGAKVNEKDNHGYTALAIAACNGQKDIVETEEKKMEHDLTKLI